MKTVMLHLTRIVASFLILVMFTSHAWSSEQLTQEEKAYLKDKGEITFVSQTVYPPFEFVDKQGDHTGMCIELARWMATEFGFKATFADKSFKEAQQAVLSGKADILTSLFYSENRDRHFDFTSTMFEVPASIFVAADRPDIKEMADLNGKIIAMQKGDYALEFLRAKGISFSVLDTVNFAEATDRVIAGQADAVIGDEQIVLYHVYSNHLTDRIKKVGQPLYIGYNCMAVKEGSLVLQSILNKGVALARKNGALDSIERKWLGVQLTTGKSFLETYSFHIMGLAAAFLVLIALIWFWNLQLRRQVAARTEELVRSEATLRIQRDLGTALGSIAGLEEALTVCLDATLKVDGIDCGGIYLVNPEDGSLSLKVHKNLSPEFVTISSYYESNSAQARLIESVEPVFLPYEELLSILVYEAKELDIKRKSGIRSIGVIPVKHEERVIAVLNAASRSRESISQFSRYALETIASQTAGALARIEADQALKRSERNLKALFETLEDFLFVLDGAGRIVGFNPVVEKRLGYSSQKLLTMNVFDLHPPDRRDEAAKIVKDMLEGKTMFCPIPLMTADGRIIPVETKVSLGSWNNKEAIFGIARDITERLEAQAARKRIEERLLAAIDAIDEGFAVYDEEDRLVLCNPKYLEIYKDSSEFIVPGAKYEAALREGAMRGQYASAAGKEEEWVSERMALHRLAGSSIEQELSDGRWVKISERKTPDGSTVGFRVDITDIKRSEKIAQDALKEKEILLKEIHHRVKNNMQVISSLLSLQSSKTESREIIDAFQEAQNRVQAMSFVHEILYQSDTLREIELQSYLNKLAGYLSRSFETPGRGVAISIHAETVYLGIDQAMPFGLIINELISNSLKYAFPSGAGGEIRIEVRKEGSTEIVASVSDNGIGLGSDFDPANAHTLGLRLVTELAEEQLEGTWRVQRDGGTKWIIRWPVSR